MSGEIYQNVRIHKELIKKVQDISKNELFVAKLESQIACLLISGIEHERKNSLKETKHLDMKLDIKRVN